MDSIPAGLSYDCAETPSPVRARTEAAVRCQIIGVHFHTNAVYSVLQGVCHLFLSGRCSLSLIEIGNGLCHCLASLRSEFKSVQGI
jgi:hypothetical protein